MITRAALGAAAAAGLLAMAGCGGSGPAGPSHADHLACRTVYRIHGLYTASGGAGLGLAPGAPSGALQQVSADNLRLFRDMQAASVKLETASPKAWPAILGPSERDCTALGITAANAENMGGTS